MAIFYLTKPEKNKNSTTFLLNKKSSAKLYFIMFNLTIIQIKPLLSYHKF